MVSENYVLNSDGTLKFISYNGADGNSNNNVITWLRKNTHAYVSKQIDSIKINLKQLDDNNRKLFADGSSSINYITNTNGEYDVFLKFDSDIYYKTEPYTPEGESSPNEDYVLVSIAKELPEGEDESTWNKWSKYKLVGVYEACQINNKLHSLSGQTPINNITQLDSISQAKIRGSNFNIIDYETCILFALLFYGYYSSLNSQEICGYGTLNKVNSVHYPKLTGLTDELAMKDTTSITGNGASSPNTEQIIAGYGDDIKSINFWGLENYWGDLKEWVYNVYCMDAFRQSGITSVLPYAYVADLIDSNGSVIITKQNGTNITYTSKEDFLNDYTTNNFKFIGISNKNNYITRVIELVKGDKLKGFIKKMTFGNNSDIIPKDFTNKTGDVGFCDFFEITYSGRIMYRSGNSIDNGGGISNINFFNQPSSKSSDIGTRLIYEGTKETIHIINDTIELF